MSSGYSGALRLWRPDGKPLPHEQSPIMEVLRTGLPALDVELAIERPDGTRVPVLANFAALRNGQHEVTGAIASFTDLTERKKLEQQSLRSQRMESIGTLAGGIAHDLNNSLGPIMMSLDLLRMKITDPGSRELLAIMDSSAQRGADMVRQILSFARGVEGRRAEVEVPRLVREIEILVHETFLRHIEIRTSVPPGLWTVMGDPTQLHQVLLNLCLNARDAMPDGGVLVVSAGNREITAPTKGSGKIPPPGPALIACWRSRTVAPAYRRRSWRIFSIRFSRPRNSAKARVSVCRPRSPSSRATAVLFAPKASWGKARRFKSSSRRNRQPRPRRR